MLNTCFTTHICTLLHKYAPKPNKFFIHLFNNYNITIKQSITMLRTILLVGLGSAGGGILRYLAGRWIHTIIPTSFPIGTMVVNILGCFIIGLVYCIFSKNTTMDSNLQLLLATGFCGGFTTFSSFMHENYAMIENGNFIQVAIYTGLSIILGLLALYFAIYLCKHI